jgi:D-lactate dehydrogenase
VHAACAAIAPLRDAGAKALELMDRASLRTVQDTGMPASFKGLGTQAAALLAEFQEESGADRSELERRAADACARLSLLEPARFTSDPTEQARLWLVRQGLFPSVGAVRKSGTTVIIEDVAFPLDRLADAADDLTALFHQHGYPEAIVFGHAKDGNLHFVITQSFNDPASVGRYERFIDDLVPLVVQRHGGALKAEHGTGRNMAPFVEAEWGKGARGHAAQAAADPRGLLNPASSRPRAARICRIRRCPPSKVDACTECGFCEPRCPSRELTLTPRQRIVMRREMARPGGGREARGRLAGGAGGGRAIPPSTPARWTASATACPVGIDTGKLTKRLRQKLHGGAAHAVACSTAMGFPRSRRWRARRSVSATRCIPLWREGIPAPPGERHRPAPARRSPPPVSPASSARCPASPTGSPQEAVVRVSERAGLSLHPARRRRHAAAFHSPQRIRRYARRRRQRAIDRM